MNIAYLTQLTNLEISDKNPLEYVKEYDQNPDFESVLQYLTFESDEIWKAIKKVADFNIPF